MQKIRYVLIGIVAMVLLLSTTTSLGSFIVEKKIVEDNVKNSGLNGAVLEVTTDKDVYDPSETVTIYLTNIGDEALFGCGPLITVYNEDDEVDNLTFAGEVLQAALESLVVVLPYEVDDRGNNQWGYKEMVMGNVSDVYTKGIEELEVGMLRGLVVPERTVTQNMAAVGSYNQAQIHSERMLDAAKMDVDNFLDDCNSYCVP